MEVRKIKLMLSVSSWNRFSVSRMEDLFFKVESLSMKIWHSSLRIHCLFMRKMKRMDKRNSTILMALMLLRSHSLLEKSKIKKK